METAICNILAKIGATHGRIGNLHARDGLWGKMADCGATPRRRIPIGFFAC